MNIPRKRRYGATTFVLGFAVEAGMVTESVSDGHGGAVSATFVRVDRSWRSPAVSYTVLLKDKRGLDHGMSAQETGMAERKGVN